MGGSELGDEIVEGELLRSRRSPGDRLDLWSASFGSEPLLPPNAQPLTINDAATTAISIRAGLLRI